MKGSFQLLRLELTTDRDAFVARGEELAALQLEVATTDRGVLAWAAVALHHA